jgi:hypothetical protein
MSRDGNNEFDHPRSFHDHYDPNQPRVPRGHSDGGQWTSDGQRALSDIAELPPPDLRGDGPHPGLRTQYALMRPGDVPLRVPNAPARAPVKPPVRPNPFISALRVMVPIGVAWQLYELLSEYNSPDQPVVLGLQSQEFRRLGPKAFGFVQRLTQKETKDYCPSLEEVQKLVDEAARKLGPRNEYRNSKEDAAYGNAFEEELKKLLDDHNIDRAKNNKPPLEWQKTFGPGGELNKKRNEAGVKVPDITDKGKTTCFYQVTTGDPTGVGQGMRLLVENFSRTKEYSEGTDIVVVTQVKPSQVKPRSLPLPLPLVPERER